MDNSSTLLSSGQLVKAAMLASRDLGKNERLVMIAIAAHGNGHGDSWPSIATIGEYVGVSERTVQRIVAKLVQLGHLVAKLRKGATTVYRFTAAVLGAVIKAVNPRQNGDQGATKQATTPDTESVDVSPEVGSEVGEASKRVPRSRWRDFIPSGASKGNKSMSTPAWMQAPGNLPNRPGTARCDRHSWELASNCRTCAGEAKGGI